MRRARSGFTLVEMAMVMVIMGLIMLTVFPALNAVRQANQRSLTQSNLRSLMLATASYVQANGCLPCPAGAGIAGANFGRLGYSSTAIACGTCSAPEGIPPFVNLGLPASMAHDGWGHWFTMRVDPALTTLPANLATCGTTNSCSVFAPPSAPCNATDVTNGFCLSTQIGFADKGLCAAGLSAKTTKAIFVTVPGGARQQVAVIFVSHGSSGYGSYYAAAQAGLDNGFRLPFTSQYANCSATGGYAICNASNSETAAAQYYDAPTVTGSFDPYDDILAYADRNMLVSMLGNNGCQTVW